MLRSSDGGKQRDSTGPNPHRAKDSNKMKKEQSEVNSQRDCGLLDALWVRFARAGGGGARPGPQRAEAEAMSTHSPIYLRCTASSEFPFGEFKTLWATCPVQAQEEK